MKLTSENLHQQFFVFEHPSPSLRGQLLEAYLALHTILRSQLATQLTAENDYMANFSESSSAIFRPRAPLTVISAAAAVVGRGCEQKE